MDRCDACDFQYDLARAEAASQAIVEGAQLLAAIISDPVIDAGRRREPDTWSPLEYGCHVRDVLLVQRERALLARREPTPQTATPMGRDERADHDGYADQRPADVATQLTQAAKLFANVLDRLGSADWDRAMIYTYPSVAEHPLRWLAVHTEHEVRHHLRDVKDQIA